MAKDLIQGKFRSSTPHIATPPPAVQAFGLAPRAVPRNAVSGSQLAGHFPLPANQMATRVPQSPPVFHTGVQRQSPTPRTAPATDRSISPRIMHSAQIPSVAPANRSSQEPLAHVRQSMPASIPVRDGQAVQRRVFIAGAKQKKSALSALITTTAQVDDFWGACQIAGTWHHSYREHRFASKEKFIQAIERAVAARSQDRTIFASGNRLFSTRDTTGGREPTHYFSANVGGRLTTGRLRQQHPSGPLAQVDRVPKTHLFLPDTEYAALLKLREMHNKDALTTPELLQNLTTVLHGRHQPFLGAHHIEYAGNGGVLNWHASGGTVSEIGPMSDLALSFALTNILGI